MRITGDEHEVRKNRMLYAAYELFCELGIDNVSLAMIAKKAGVSLNSIFRYFDNKTELLKQIQLILWGDIIASITEHNSPILNETKSGLDQVRVILYGFENLYQNHSQYILFAYEYKAYLTQKRLKLPEDSLKVVLNDVCWIFVASIERGQADGTIATHHNAEQLFVIVWSIMRYYVEQLVVHDRIYEGENPWIPLFPQAIEQILNHLKP